jgi:hypothetical protein
MNKLPQRFADKVDFSGECWLWIAGKFSRGYGAYGNDKKVVQAHRYSWEHHFGKIPNGLNVLHKCDVRNCVNPSHLFIGTQLENNADRDSKGRTARGIKQGSSKLTKSQVDDIRNTYKPWTRGEFSQKALAKKYGVSQTNIGFIVNQKQWVESVGI